MSQPDQAYPILPEEEIRDLVRRYQAGEKCAADVVILHNEGVIVKIARRYYTSGVTGDTPFDDLLQLGRMGMLRAMQDFNPDNGAKFTTYAFAWVQQSIRRYGKRSGTPIGMGYKATETRGQVGRVRAKFEQDNGREPTVSELAKATGLSKVKLNQLRVNVVSIDDEDSFITPLAELLVDRDSNVEEEAGELADVTFDRAIWQAVDQLPETWATVIRMRFGNPPATLAQVAEELHVSRERVREIEKQSFNSLRVSPFCSTFRGSNG